VMPRIAATDATTAIDLTSMGGSAAAADRGPSPKRVRPSPEGKRPEGGGAGGGSKRREVAFAEAKEALAVELASDTPPLLPWRDDVLAITVNAIGTLSTPLKGNHDSHFLYPVRTSE
jgi:hypothetical protein